MIGKKWKERKKIEMETKCKSFLFILLFSLLLFMIVFVAVRFL